MTQRRSRSLSCWKWRARPRRLWARRWILCCDRIWKDRRTALHATTFCPARFACMDVEQLGRLRDILEAARLIARYVSDTTEAAFRADRQKQEAVIRRIEIIGEAGPPERGHAASRYRAAFPQDARHAQHRGTRLRERGSEHRVAGRDRPRSRSVRHARKILRHARATSATHCLNRRSALSRKI